jgi:hypothetical protein
MSVNFEKIGHILSSAKEDLERLDQDVQEKLEEISLEIKNAYSDKILSMLRNLADKKDIKYLKRELKDIKLEIPGIKEKGRRICDKTTIINNDYMNFINSLLKDVDACISTMPKLERVGTSSVSRGGRRKNQTRRRRIQA